MNSINRDVLATIIYIYSVAQHTAHHASLLVSTPPDTPVYSFLIEVAQTTCATLSLNLQLECFSPAGQSHHNG